MLDFYADVIQLGRSKIQSYLCSKLTTPSLCKNCKSFKARPRILDDADMKSINFADAAGYDTSFEDIASFAFK